MKGVEMKSSYLWQGLGIGVFAWILFWTGFCTGLHAPDRFNIQHKDGRYRVQKWDGVWYRNLELGGKSYKVLVENVEPDTTLRMVPRGLVGDMDTISTGGLMSVSGWCHIRLITLDSHYETRYPEPCHGTFSSPEAAQEWIETEYKHSRIRPAKWRNR